MPSVKRIFKSTNIIKLVVTLRFYEFMNINSRAFSETNNIFYLQNLALDSLAVVPGKFFYFIIVSEVKLNHKI